MSDLPTLLPPNVGPLEASIEQTIASDAEGFAALLETISDPAQCPESALPFLAWGRSVDEWDPAWPVARKREVLGQSIGIHRRKGTVGAVKAALAAMGYGNAYVHEFRDEPTFDGLALDSGAVFSEPMRWFHYAVTIDQPISAEMAASIKRRLDAVAPVRSVLIYVRSNIIATMFDSIAFDAGHTFDEIYQFEEAENV